MYSDKALIFIRAITPLHVGSGRGYSSYVDLPVQRDEFGFPTIWASSLKGAVKANLSDDTVKKCLGPYPEELEQSEVKQSRVVFTDARLVMIPARILQGVYTYVTSPHMIEMLCNYWEVVSPGKCRDELAQKLKTLEKAIVSKEELLERDKVILNEIQVDADNNVDGGITNFFANLLPKDLKNNIENKGLVVVPDKNSLSLRVVDRSMVIQYRVALDRETKTVKPGALWSEEYVPVDTVFVSLMMGSGNDCPITDIVSKIRVMFVGGRETIGKGLVEVIHLRVGQGGSHDIP